MNNKQSIPQIVQPIFKGYNNGTFGVGMGRGGFYPSSMNGPFGYQNRPLPINLSQPDTLINTLDYQYYNAPEFNAPFYNQPINESIIGYSNGFPPKNSNPFDFYMKQRKFSYINEVNDIHN